MRNALPLLLVSILLAGPPAMAAQGAEPPCAACLALVVTPAQALALPLELHGLQVLLAAPPAALPGLGTAIGDTDRRGGRPGLYVQGIPRTSALPDVPWGRVTMVVLEISPAEARQDAAALAFTVKTLLTTIRGAAGPPVQLGLAGAVDEALARETAPYADFIVPQGGGLSVPGLAAWGTAAGAFTDALAATRTAGPSGWLWRLPDDPLETAAASAAAARAARWLVPGLVTPSTVDVRCGGRAAETFLDPQSLATIAIAACGPEDPVIVSPEEPGVERMALDDGTTLVRVPAPGAPDRFASGVDVVGARRLTVEEVIAGHQAAVARQARLVENRISRGTLSLAFEAPGFPAPVTIASETTMFVGGGRTELAQDRIRVNGIEFGGGVPRLPIIEPERVSSPPLTITLTDVYRYRLEGTEDVERGVARVPAYVVAFEPVDDAVPGFRGRAWIAQDSFAMLRVSAVQTGLRGAIVASEQTDAFVEASPGVWVLARSEVRQLYEGAGHRTPIHRVLELREHTVNVPDFAARQQAAYRSEAVMLRETPDGFRYLQRERAQHPAGTEAPAVIEPVVAGRATRVRTVIGGVIVDPNITRPLPFAGLSYVDFDLFGTGTQLNVFFGGTYGQAAFSVPSLGGSRWQLAGRAFGIASSYNDRSFVRGLERYDENIRQRPAHLSVWTVRPLTPRVSLRLGYELDYTAFSRADTTAQAFAVPADQVLHGARVALDVQRAGWHVSAWWNPAARTGWRAWGLNGSEPARGTFQRYGAQVTRATVLSPGLTLRAEAGWMAGRGLDRFSRYTFGTFDNRLRGYPAALIRYDRGGVVRGAVAWSPGRLVRLDAFLDSAYVRDPGFGPRGRSYTGVGAAVEAPAPFGTLVAAEWGFGLRGVTTDGGTGTHVVRISAFKVF
jgi:hypothetical protein